MANLLGVFGNDQEAIQKIIDISLKLGTADAGRAFALADLFKDEGVKADFIAKVQTKTPPQAQKLLTMFETVQQSGGVLNMEMVLTAYMADETAGNQLIQDLEEFKLAQEAGPITATVIGEVFGNDAMAAVIKDWEYFSSLDRDMQTTYMTLVQTAFETVENNPEAYNAWKAVQAAGADTSVAAYAGKNIGFQGTTAKARTDSMTKETETPSSGGGPTASSLDDILKKLRDVRKNQIDVTTGFDASARAIDNLFGGGGGISLFSGIEQDMRSLGAGEDLISLIAGMDPDEFKKRKDSLFNFNKQTGEIIGFKARLQNIGEALSAIALGEYVSGQQRIAQESKNQVIAFNQLRAAGYSVAEAYDAIQNASVAAAIAGGKATRQQIQDMLEASKARIEAEKAVKMLTPEGMEDVFNDGFSKAMEAFEAQEKKLTLEFDVKVKADKGIIEAAQNEIAEIQYQIDDYEADLKGVEDQETKINKTYDDKLDALEKVKNANQKILDQEKGKLSIAEAITRGDLYAAAQAAQQVRQSSASGYFESQTSALHAARESALGQVRSNSGLSRIQIEEKIKGLSDEIFSIEEKRLEPAAERVRLAEVELAKRIEEITVLGNTKAQWEAIKNGIDLARTNSDQYTKAMQLALDKVTEIKDAWNGIISKEVTLTTRTVTVDGNSGSSGGGDGSGTGPTPEEIRAAQIKADQASSKAAFEASGLGAAGFINKIDAEVRTAAAKAAATEASRDKAMANRAPEVKKPIIAVTGNATTQRATVAASAPKPSSPPKGISVRALMGSMAGGGLVNYLANGGAPKFARPSWAKTMGTDRIPTMLTPGEFVVSRPAVSKIGVKSLNSINNGEYPGSSVYNYNLSVNVSSVSDPNAIAQTVMSHIRKVESQRIRSNKF
jgi:hypothetical protein